MKEIECTVNGEKHLIYKIPIYGKSNNSRRIASAKETIAKLIKKLGVEKTKYLLEEEGMRLYVVCENESNVKSKKDGKELVYYKGKDLIFTNKYIIDNLLSKKYVYAQATYRYDFTPVFWGSLPKTITGEDKKIKNFTQVKERLLQEVKYYTTAYNKTFAEEYKSYGEELTNRFYGKSKSDGWEKYKESKKEIEKRELEEYYAKELKIHKANKKYILSVLRGKIPENIKIEELKLGNFVSCSNGNLPQIVQFVVGKERTPEGSKYYAGLIAFPLTSIVVKDEDNRIDVNVELEYIVKANKKSPNVNDYGYFTGDDYEKDIKKYFNTLLEDNREHIDNYIKGYKKLKGNNISIKYKLNGNNY